MAAALILCLCMVDGAHSVAPSPAPAAATTPKVSLQIQLWQAQPSSPPEDGTLQAAGASGERSRKSYRGPATLEIFRRIEGSYVLLETEKLKDGQWQGKLSEGWYWALVRAPGYARYARRIELRETARHDFELHAAHSLNVRVMKKEGEQLSALKGATVLVQRDRELPFGALTDSNGRTNFQSLPPGPWKVRVLAPGYEPYEASTESDLLIRLTPVMTLRVHVKANEQPVPGATVHIAGVSLWPSRAVQTGPKGYVDVTGLRAGDYALYAAHGNRASAVESSVELLAQRGMNEITLELMPGDFVLARIHDVEGNPIAGARGTFSAHGPGQFLRHGESDRSGLLRLGPFFQQGGTLLVRAPGFVSRVVPAVLPGPQEVELIRAGVVTGRVLDAKGFPVEGATVEVVGTDVHGMPVAVTSQSAEVAEAHFEWAMTSQNVLVPAGELGVLLGPVPPIPLGSAATQNTGQLVTNEKGRFEVKGVPPGKLVVLARHPEHLDGKSEDFELAPGSSADVEVVLGEGTPLTGRVLDHRDFPVESARVRVSGRGFERIVAAESDGTFVVPSAPQDVTLRVTDPKRPLLVLYERRVEETERDDEIKLTLPEPREPVEIRIVDARGEPIGLAQVNLVSREPTVPLRATRFSDEDGRVKFDEARGLEVRLRVVAPDFVQSKQERRLPAEHTIRLTRALTAEGRVTAVRGRLPAAGAVVTLQSETTSVRATANEVGEYRLEGVPPGPARLHAEHSEYGKAETSVTVRPGVGGRDATLPDLDLQPAGLVTGRVVDDEGRPLAGVLVAAEPISAYLRSGSVGPGVATTDEGGHFTLEILEGDAKPILYAAAPARGVGWLADIELNARGEASGVEVPLTELDEASAGELGSVLVSLVEEDGEVWIHALPRNGAAFEAGVRVDDELVAVDGYGFGDVEEARELLSGTPGTDVSITLNRRGRQLEVRTVREAFRRQIE